MESISLAVSPQLERSCDEKTRHHITTTSLRANEKPSSCNDVFEYLHTSLHKSIDSNIHKSDKRVFDEYTSFAETSNGAISTDEQVDGECSHQTVV